MLNGLGGVEMGDGSDGSGDWGLYPSLSSPVLFVMAIVANILKGLGGRFKSFKLGGGDQLLLPKPIRYRNLVGIIIDRHEMRLRGCDRGD